MIFHLATAKLEAKGIYIARAGPMQDLGSGPLWAVISWRHRVQSTVLRS